MKFPWKKQKNKVHNIDTKRFENETGEFDAIVIGLDIPDAGTLDRFVGEVIDLFKNQRMISPPDTANMTITIEGECSAQEFVDHWIKIGESDQALNVFMDMMVVADVLRFDDTGATDKSSLLVSEAEGE